MKRIILSAMAAAALLCSCNRDEIVETNPQNAISFDNAFVDHTTRATEITKDDLTEFYVHGIRKDNNQNVITVFDNARVYREGEKPENYVYKYDDTRYWFDGNYEFVACNLSDANTEIPPIVTMTPGDDRLLSSGKLIYTMDPETDLIVAEAKRTVSENATVGTEKVDLTFNHLMSEIAFEITNSLGNAYDLVINGATNTEDNNASCILLRYPQYGTYHFSDSTWTVGNRMQSGTITIDMVPTSVTIPGNPGSEGNAENIFRTDSKFVYPTASGYGQEWMHAWIRIDIVHNGENVPAYTLDKNQLADMLDGIPMGVRFEPGKKYLIKINVSPETINAKEIEFTVEKVNDYTDGGII